MDVQPYVPLIGVVVGGVLTLLGGFWSESRSARQHRKSLKGALTAEVNSIAEVLTRREYLSHLDALIQEVESSGVPRLAVIPVGRSDPIIFRANAGKIGLLEDSLPTKLAAFHLELASFMEDVEAMDKLASGELTVDDCATRLRGTRDTLKRVLDCAKGITG